MKILLEAICGAIVVFGVPLSIWALQEPLQFDCANSTYPIQIDVNKMTIEKCKENK